MKALKRKDSQNGAAIVEFALILPILLILVFGIIEFSIMLYDKAVITNASREGARRGVLFQHQGPVGSDIIIQTVNNYTTNNLISLGGEADLRTIAMSTCSDDPGEGDFRSARIRVEYDYSFLVMNSFITAFTGPITLVAETVMRCE
jgi:Flp pilus assembly protein TadG